MKVTWARVLIVLSSVLFALIIVSWARSHLYLDIISYTTPERNVGLTIRPGQLVFNWLASNNSSCAPCGFNWHNHRYSPESEKIPTGAGYILSHYHKPGSFLDAETINIEWNIMGLAHTTENGDTFSSSALFVPHWMMSFLVVMLPLIYSVRAICHHPICKSKSRPESNEIHCTKKMKTVLH